MSSIIAQFRTLLDTAIADKANADAALSAAINNGSDAGTIITLTKCARIASLSVDSAKGTYDRAVERLGGNTTVSSKYKPGTFFTMKTRSA